MRNFIIKQYLISFFSVAFNCFLGNRLLIMLTVIFIPQICLSQTLFEADWSKATGTTCNAITDGSVFDYDGTSSLAISPLPCKSHYSSAGHLEVFDDGPVGKNCLGVWIKGDSGVSFVEKLDVFRTTKKYIFGRVYFYHHGGVGDGTNFHFFEDYHNARNWWLNIDNPSRTSYTLTTWTLQTYNTYKYDGGRKIVYDDVPSNEWVRVEWRWELTEPMDSSTSVILSMRLYNSTDELIADNDDWHDGDTGRSLATMNAGGYRFLIDLSDKFRRGLKIGNNGPASNSDSGRFVDVASVKIIDSDSALDWIGGIDDDAPQPPNDIPQAPTQLKVMNKPQ